MRIIIISFLIFFHTVPFSLLGQVSIFPYVENGKIGYRDVSDSSLIITPRFDYIEDFKPGYSWTITGAGDFELLSNRIDTREVKFTGKFGLISSDGEIIFPPVFDLVISFFPDYAVVGEGEGILIFEDFPEGRNISFSGTLGLVNREGDLLIYPEYNSIDRVNHPDKSFWFATQDGDGYLFQDSINLGINKKINEIGNFSDGLARIRIDEDYGYLNDEGDIAIEAVYSKANNFNQGKALVKKNKHFFYIDTSGMILENEPLKFDKIDSFSEGYAKVRIMDEFGYIKPDSSFYIYPQFEDATSFFNGIAYISEKDSFGYLFTDNRKDIVKRYEEDPFSVIGLERSLPDLLRDLDSVECHSEIEKWFFNPFSYLDIAEISRIALEAMRWAPYLQNNFTNIFASASGVEGTLAGRNDFNINCISPGNQAWEMFKKKVLLKIIEDPALREITWEWIRPFLVRSFYSMPEIHQQVYADMLSYLEEYYKYYDLEKTRQFLSEYEEDFAFMHADGSGSPFRKTSALIDRLIIMYQVIEPGDVREWISRIKGELNIS